MDLSDDIPGIRAQWKAAMVERLSPLMSSKLSEALLEYFAEAEKLADEAAGEELDETKIEAASRAAHRTARMTTLAYAAEKVAGDFLRTLRPEIDEAFTKLWMALREATDEAVMSVLTELVKREKAKIS